MRKIIALLAIVAALPAAAENAVAIFAGGCFWCMEPPYDELDGVAETVSGYTGGHAEAPTYEQVTAGGTGHFEAVRVTYDPERVTFVELADVFWRNIDPFDDGGQFCDRGSSYRAAIFHGGEAEREVAEAGKADIEARFDRRVATRILPAAAFYPAEGYHQDYYQKSPLRYRYYRFSCRRDARLDAVWGADRERAPRLAEAAAAADDPVAEPPAAVPPAG